MSRRCRQRGAAMVLVMVGLVALIAMVGLAIDVSHLGLNKARLQSTVDAAALAAAKVLDQTGVEDQATAAAMNVLGINAAAHPELDDAVTNGLTVTVEYSSTLQPFTPGTTPASYVRVRAANFSMWVGFSAVVGVSNKSTSASAVAGPSPTINTACNIAPMVVCGNPAAPAPYYGYEPNVLSVLKLASGNNPGPIGPGNFQLIRLGGSGGSVVRENMAGSYNGCVEGEGNVETQTGNLVGPVTQGLNTRFGVYVGGGISEADYPPDVITAEPSPTLSYDSETGVITQGGQTVTTGSEVNFNYQDYTARLNAENYDNAPAPNGTGVPLRRELVIPIADCSGSNTGNSTIPVLGFGCYFLLQQAEQHGTENYVYGQFVTSCNSGGMPGPDPTNIPGPYIIQLYDDVESNDS